MTAMDPIQGSRRPRVVVVGAGASGALTALHLTRVASRRSTSLDITLIDPADRPASGTAFGTPNERHLLNVPAAGMSVLPEDPRHFAVWRARTSQLADPYEFVPRREWARYLRETFNEALSGSFGEVSFRHVRRTAVDLLNEDERVEVQLDDGSVVDADAVVVATGLPSTGADWAPPRLRDSAFFVPDPWAPGALDVVRRDRAAPPDVLTVGAGLTMVDVVLSLENSRSGRTVRAISRSGKLPKTHADRLLLANIPDTSDWGDDLTGMRERFAKHLGEVRSLVGDWRPAMDGVRFQAAGLWNRLTEDDRLAFLRDDVGAWNVLRHRMPRASADMVAAHLAEGTLTVSAARIESAEPLPHGGLRVGLSDGTTREVGWVVNCTGPRQDVSTLGDPFLDALIREGAELATAGMGFRTEGGRIRSVGGGQLGRIWTLGALRRGELWESTAVPEIRTQALALATSVLESIAPLPRRLVDGRLVPGSHPIQRPRDPLGMPITATPEAAVAYNAGLGRVMRLQSGGVDLLREAAELDPGFALAHATLALLGHEAGGHVDVASSLAKAREAARAKADDRERSLVEVVGLRVADARVRGKAALLRHIQDYPRDVLAVSAAVPTIAFSGIIDVQQDVWDLVERIGPAYGDHWWYASLLAFIRQDQSRFDEAGLLAEQALSLEPSSGHAVHAQTHVLYETGQHETGRGWLDHWVAESGRSASYGAHFAWHAALHDIALGDIEAVRRRYYAQLADVTGVRRLIDTASLLWRWRVAVADWDGLEVGTGFALPPADSVVDLLDRELVDAPQTPFVALHSLMAVGATGDEVRLAALVRRCKHARDSVTRTVVARVGEGLLALLAGEPRRAAVSLAAALPRLSLVGGSEAQRDVIEETLLLALLRDGQTERVAALLTQRLDRRPSPLDAQRRTLVTHSN